MENSIGVCPGRYNPALGYYCWEIMLYYDDITHEQEIHHAYQLKFWEHAREHMLDEQFLPKLLESESAMFVTVKSEQKQYFNLDLKKLVRIGNLMEIRTTVKIDGKFRIRFQHETYLKTKKGESAPKLYAAGYVEMVCVNSIKHTIMPIPRVMLNEVSVDDPGDVKPVRKPIQRKRDVLKDQASKNLSATDFSVFEWVVSDFDTDFTEVVYQAKYLQYYECARKEILSQSGCSQSFNSDLRLRFYKSTVTFAEAVRPGKKIYIKTKRPVMNSKFRLLFEQEMYLDKECTKNLVNKATVELICISCETEKMAKLPDECISNLKAVT
mmetsp:Transcript_4409/g.5116  ORF Transcript_4409/g.5116 Transcript_4409/m.5116 type:complete len:325 (-) Transcript_4409:1903-2877(-)